MAKVPLFIPQIGEGLQEARLVGVLKKPGERVKRDEPIYQMETDKAVMDVESPYEGILLEWTAEVETILAIGAEVAFMEVENSIETASSSHGQASAPTEVEKILNPENSEESRTIVISPRVRAYAKEKGVSDSDLNTLAKSKEKLLPEDVDSFLSLSSGESDYEEHPMPQKQRLLSSRLVRGTALVVPGTMSVTTNWSAIEKIRAEIKSSGDPFQPSAFTMFAFAAAKMTAKYPIFRSTLKGEDTIRTYKHVNLGIAVGLPGDELVLAVVEDADTLSWRDFATKMREKIDLARTGKDQANESMTISLTNMQSFGLRDAVPVVVPPAVATVFLGEVYSAIDSNAHASTGEVKVSRYANVAMTFDHRLLNGVGAAEFLQSIKDFVERIDENLR